MLLKDPLSLFGVTYPMSLGLGKGNACGVGVGRVEGDEGVFEFS
jgi:hypothetical protein